MRPVYKMVDTCAAEFEAATPYFYSPTRRRTRRRRWPGRRRVVIGSGPIRIGQGIEFDYCSRARGAGRCTRPAYERDHDQLQPGDRLDRLRHLRPALLRAAGRRERARHPRERGRSTTATPPVDRPVRRPDGDQPGRAADRARRADPRQRRRRRSTWPRTASGSRTSCAGSASRSRPARRSRTSRRRSTSPSGSATRCWCGRRTCSAAGRWRSSTTTTELARYIAQRGRAVAASTPILIDKYLEGKEVEVDAICDGEDVLIPGIMEHIERAGVHSGDSIAVYPGVNLYPSRGRHDRRLHDADRARRSARAA